MLDTEPLYTTSFNEVLGKYGAVFTNEMKIRSMGSISADVHKMLIDELKLPVSMDEFGIEIAAALGKNMENPRVLPGIKDAMLLFFKS